jgi:hypothetical protein
MPFRRPLAPILLVLSLAVLAGCGDSRGVVPDLSHFQPPQGMTKTTYLAGGVRFEAPVNWATQTGAPPLVVTLGSGPAIVTVWRYERSKGQALPDNAASLQQARTALIAAAGARDGSFKVISSAVIDLHGAPGVELDALETIRGEVRRVRSTHLYKNGAELVVDEYAPVSLFHAVDRTVFSPLLHSVRIARVGSA